MSGAHTAADAPLRARRGSIADIALLAWPVLVGQLAVMANGIIDTVMAGRASSEDVAAVGLGASVYTTVFMGAMGILIALSPIVAQHYGAGHARRIGSDFKQGVWLALALAVPGVIVLSWTDAWMAFAAPPAAVAERARLYLLAVAAGLPAALLFRTFSSLNNGLGRPWVVMTINLVGVGLKLPLNALFIHGWRAGEPGWSVPALGGPGCGVATALIAWASLAIALAWAARDPWYRPFGLSGWERPNVAQLLALLRLGVPIGASTIVEVSAFTFMAVFVARFGVTVAASHQIAANLAGVCFMFAMSIANATSVLAAQSLGAGDPRAARRTIARGFRMTLVTATLVAGTLVLARHTIAGFYSRDPQVLAAAGTLIALVAAYHFFDAVQTFFSNALRAYRIAASPMLVYLVAMWGVGLAGGWWLTFAPPPPLAVLAGERSGAAGFWVAGIASCVAAAIGLALILLATWRARSREGRLRSPAR